MFSLFLIKELNDRNQLADGFKGEAREKTSFQGHF